jgi:hypothetical protein
MEAAPALYRQRDPKASPLYQLVDEHYDDLKRVYGERFERTYGPWQGYWDRVIEKFRACGDLFYGFARVYCDTCRHCALRAFSCGTRGFCASCEAKRRALWAEHVVRDVLPPQNSYRMGTFTMPKCLRPIFMRDRSRMGHFCRQAYESTTQFLCDALGGRDGAPYFVCVIQHFGDQANVHYHAHALISLGIKTTDGTFLPLPEDFDFSPLEERFRRAVLDMLVRKKLITEDFRAMLLSWKNSGFGADTSVVVPAGDTENLERVAAYVLRPPVSLQRMTYQSGAATVVYRGRYNPQTGSNFQVLDAKTFLLNLLCLVPTCVSYYTSLYTLKHCPDSVKESLHSYSSRWRSGGS